MTSYEMKMVCIELKPDLSNCIETLSKKEYERILYLLLREEVMDEGLLERLEVLRLFLESTNFRHLRSQYEKHLTQGRKVTFLIYPEEGKATYKLMVE